MNVTNEVPVAIHDRMQITAASPPPARAGDGLVRPWRTSVGLTALAAITGAVLAAWIALHLAGVLGVFAGQQSMDGYAALLHRVPLLLWLQRGVLALAALLHVMAVTRLTARALRARPVAYVRPRRTSGWAARSMRWTGALLLAFIVLHVLHMTTGTLHPRFVPGAAYQNLVVGLRTPAVALGYAGAALLLGLHLRHGLLALCRGLFASPRMRATAYARPALVLGVLIGAGFALVPLAIASGVLR